jgi:hypothetical protein|nr:MAG TPA: hypothetical protein [Caudoviricetes sp.]
MRPKKYPYLGAVKAKEATQKDKLDLVAFPNIAIRKDLLRNIYTVVKNYDNTTIIHIRFFKLFEGYKEQKFKVNLSYEETMRILNLEAGI